MLEHINECLTGALVPLMLTAAGLFYGIKLRFFHILRPVDALRGLKSDRRSSGVSSVGAVALALAGTLGVGNIVGVSSAIALGGFGAVFWMWISAFCAMLLKYAEIVLAMRHRRTSADGSRRGGAVYYIIDLLSSAGLARLGRVLAGIFAVLFLITSLTMGNMLQVNAVAEALEGVMHVPTSVTGVILALAIFFVIRKGTDGITRLTGILVPLMSLGYVAMSVAALVANADGIGAAFSLIFSSALKKEPAAAGIGGFIFTGALRYGVMRGLVSNEAGCGTAPTAHALADCDTPAKQGVWGIFEVFVDTVLLCTLTALTVISEYNSVKSLDGSYMMMTITAYSKALGNHAAYFLAFAVLCFGLATVVCWAHYGLSCIEYFGNGKRARTLFTVIYSAAAFIGSVSSPSLVWQLSDLAMGAMTVINLSVIIPMHSEVCLETERLFPRRKPFVLRRAVRRLSEKR